MTHNNYHNGFDHYHDDEGTATYNYDKYNYPISNTLNFDDYFHNHDDTADVHVHDWRTTVDHYADAYCHVCGAYRYNEHPDHTIDA